MRNMISIGRLPGQLSRYLLIFVGVLGMAYISLLLLLTFRQRHLIYRPRPDLSMLPSAADFGLPYEDVWIPIPKSTDTIHGWWIQSASPQEQYAILPQEPVQVLKSPRVMLYLCGVGRNMGDYNYLSRVAAFRQLGFSVLVFDYRGYGRSEGNFPNEAQLYADSQAAWNYLRDTRHIPAEQVIIYGESMGGAIALDLAIKHPEAGGLIMQSSFTSMLEVVKQKSFAKAIPLNLVLTERFDSIAKISSLKMPVLFLHGGSDSVVPSEMSKRLYAAAPEPKQLFLIPKADHVSIYQPGDASYFKAIQKFTEYTEE
ncbi:alpha/beta hydrolase [Nodosilinea nodulosa]|uniref:alpha/beta hydrolase n=1 Tax=Nodosilinea nodulosa TaxID=416001 RepID=UPI00031A9936|nr:alpha/beta fold hydrolase [Nodosilinea nodulosa]